MRIQIVSPSFAGVVLILLVSSVVLGQPAPPPNELGVMVTTTAACHAWLFTAMPATVTTAKWSGGCGSNGNAGGDGTMLVDLADGRTMRFDGTMRDGFATGPGKLMLPDRKFYDGGFFRGVFEGRGTLYSNGAKVEATFSGGVLASEVVMTLPDGGKVVGNLSNDLANGSVVATLKNGNTFNGYMKNYKLEGRGTMDFANGDRYVGDWSDGLPDGTGTLTTKQGEVSSGTWQRGCFRGGGPSIALMVPPATCR